MGKKATFQKRCLVEIGRALLSQARQRCWDLYITHEQGNVNGRAFHVLSVTDTNSREVLALAPSVELRGSFIVDTLLGLTSANLPPKVLTVGRSSEFASAKLMRWAGVNVAQLQFRSVLADEHPQCFSSFKEYLSGQRLESRPFENLKQVTRLLESWRLNYNSLVDADLLLFSRATRVHPYRAQRVWRPSDVAGPSQFGATQMPDGDQEDL